MRARVAACHGARFELWFEDGTSGDATLAGRLRHEGVQPVTGDWVAVEGGVIVALEPRATAILRQAAGERTAAQAIAANVDLAAMVTAPGDLSVRRAERYLMAIAAGGARPLLCLNKADLVDDPAALAADLARAGAPVVTVSALGGDVAALAAELAPGVTLALLGSSGVGKSTLVNALTGRAEQEVGAIAADGRGRHTTTRRELIRLPGGAFLIDTPGMRELMPWADDGALDAAFADVDALAADCRFRDCRHDGEPGCAVAGAVARGELDEDRLAGYRKLAREQAWELRRRDHAAQAEERRIWKIRARALRQRERER